MRAVLRARHILNKNKKYGKGCVRLNAAESRAVNSHGALSHSSPTSTRGVGQRALPSSWVLTKLKMCGGLAR